MKVLELIVVRLGANLSYESTKDDWLTHLIGVNCMVCESYSSKATRGGGWEWKEVGRRNEGGEIAIDQEEIQPVFLTQQENRATPRREQGR